MTEIFIALIKWCMMPYVVTICLILLIAFIIAVCTEKWSVLERAKVMARPMSILIDRLNGKLPISKKDK
ncbi:MAG: hypothetical protein QNJ26_07065 [Desulfobacterales bacterium]|nr:hypothetical protein [Desulfobacterales bacterium]